MYVVRYVSDGRTGRLYLIYRRRRQHILQSVFTSLQSYTASHVRTGNRDVRRRGNLKPHYS